MAHQHSTGRAPGGRVFVGRRRELAQLRADVADAGLDTMAGRPAAGSRVLLIVGRPGSGRSALAAELARQLAPHYPDGVLYARLTSAGDVAVPTGQTARGLLRALGGAPVPGAAEDELARAVRERLAGRRALLLLDDVQRPEQLRDLLPDTRDCLVVATAPGPLAGVVGARPCALGGLDVASGVTLLVHGGAGEVRVTVDPRAAEELVAECAGQPAALVLTGGWLAAHPEASLVDALRGLRATSGEPLERALAMVRRSLPAAADDLLDLLSLLPDGRVDAQLASALAGCPVSVASELLELLARRGLLHPEPRYVLPGCLEPLLSASLAGRRRPDLVALARARMLERVVRQLFACWARVQPAGSAARRGAAGLPHRLRFDTPAAASAWLADRLPSVLAALRLAVEDGAGELDTLARRLARTLARALLAHWGEERAGGELYEVYELVRAVARRRGLHREEAAVELALGDYDADAGRTTRAVTRYRAALRAAREGRDDRVAGRALESLGDVHRARGDLPRAADWYGRARELYQAGGELSGQARTHGLLGAVHAAAGEWPGAVREWRAAAALHRRLRDRRGCAWALGEVARAQSGAGRRQEARRVCREAVDLARECGDRALLEGLQRLLGTLRR